MLSRGSRKRPIAILLIALAVGLAAFVFLHDSSKPRFVPASSEHLRQRSPEFVLFNYLTERPFDGGKMWIACKAGPSHMYLFDIEKRAIEGELLHAVPAFMTADPTKLVCVQRKPSNVDSFPKMAITLAARLAGETVSPANNEETFWLLDLKRNSAKKLGSVLQARRITRSLVPSPGFDRAFIDPTSATEKDAFYLCDIPANTFKRIETDLAPEGWWDSNTLVALTRDNDYVLFDIVTQTTSPFLGRSKITRILADLGGTEDPGTATLSFTWNGKEYDTFLSKRYGATNSYLYKIQRPYITPKLISQNFKLGWLGQFNTAQTHYVHAAGWQNYNAIYLRDLAAKSETALISNNGSAPYNAPRFNGSQVIFLSSNALWQIDLTGSNLTKLFPPDPK